MPRFQFSLGWLMIAITAVAILLFFAVTFAGFIGAALGSVVWCIVPTPLVVCAIFGRGNVQAFSVGALVPWLTMITTRIPSAASFFSMTIWLLILGGICGSVAIATRRWLERHGGE